MQVDLPTYSTIEVDDSAQTESLETTFRHPAGLPTARRLVRAVIQAERLKPSCHNGSLMSLPNTSWAADLREILEFGESRSPLYQQNDGSTNGQEAGMGLVAGHHGLHVRLNHQNRHSLPSQAVRSMPSSSGSARGHGAQSNFMEHSFGAVHSLQTRPSPSTEQSRRPALPILLPASQRTYTQIAPVRLAPAFRNISSTELLPLPNATPIKTSKMPARKRKRLEDGSQEKKQKTIKTTSSKRGPKPKDKSGSAAYKLDEVLWMRILEFSPPSFLFKARLISKTFKEIIDRFDSIFINCCKENYGADMPLAPAGLKVKQYLDLLQGKGCLEPNCGDKKASKTSWSWVKRWCATCWKNKLEREDRVMKSRQNDYTRITLTKMLECLPAGMHDSFLKPHDYVDDMDSRPRGAPRLYKYYMTDDIAGIIEEYEALTPPPFAEDAQKSADENRAARDAYQIEMDGLDDKRAAFFAERKAKNDAHMAIVKQIEQGVRKRMLAIRAKHDECRNARKELFSRRARQELPHIREDFVVQCASYKAAVRIFRDGGTERGWLTLKAKIENEWKAAKPDGEGVGDSNLTWASGHGWQSSANLSTPEAASTLQEVSNSLMEFPEDYPALSLSPFVLADPSQTTSFGNPTAATASFFNGTANSVSPFPFSMSSLNGSSAIPTSNLPGSHCITSINGASSSSTQISVLSLLRPQTPSATPHHYNSF